MYYTIQAANSKGADQTARLRRQVCAIVVRIWHIPHDVAHLGLDTISYSTLVIVFNPRHLCRGVYSFRFSVRPYVCAFVRSFVLPSRSWNYFKVLRASNSSGVYLTNHSSESIHIWTIGTLEVRFSFHDASPQGKCLRSGLEVKI